MVKVEDLLKTEHNHDVLHSRLLSLIVSQAGSQCGAIYGVDDTTSEPHFYLLAGHGAGAEIKRTIRAGEGILGEVIIRKSVVLTEKIPLGYMTIQSGLGEAQANFLTIVPLVFKDQLYGAIELGSFSPVSDHDLAWLKRAAESIAAHFFNRKTQENTQQQLEAIARKQEVELIQVRQLQVETYRKLETQFEEAQQERARSLAILEGCVDGVISFDQAGNILFTNSALREMFGFTKEEFDVKTIGTLMPIEIFEDGRQHRVVVAGSQKDVTVRTEVSGKKSTGEGIDVLVTSSQFTLQRQVLFNFFIQKISVDLF